MAILFHEDFAKTRLANKRKIKDWIKSVVETECLKAGDINIIFTNDERLLRMNIEHLGHDYYTDIISYDYSEGGTLNGDLFISLERVEENAVRYGVERNMEVLRVIIHGVLHLMGYKDSKESERNEMRSMEDKCLNIYYYG